MPPETASSRRAAPNRSAPPNGARRNLTDRDDPVPNSIIDAPEAGAEVPATLPLTRNVDDTLRAVRHAAWAQRRRELFALYFRHAPGTPIQKRALAHAFIEAHADPLTREKLTRLHHHLLAVINSVPPDGPDL